MGDINFLSAQKGDKKDKKKEPLKKIEWTTPEVQKAENKKEEHSSYVSVFKKEAPAEDKIRQSREVVLKTIGEKEKAEKFKPIIEPKNIKEVKKVETVEVKKPELPKPIKKNIEPIKPAPAKVELNMLAKEKDIDPRRINFLNRLIDSWSRRVKAKQEKKNVEPIPDLPKKEEKISVKNEKEVAREGIKPEIKEVKPKKEVKKPAPDSKALIDSHVLETNLIKGENVLHFIDWQKNGVTLTLFGLFAVLLVAGAFVWLTLWERAMYAQIIDADKNIAELNGNIEQVKRDIQEFAALEKKVKVLSQLLDDHIRWTNFFKFLEDNTLSDVFYLGGFSGDISGIYTFSANAGSFNSISEQTKVFKRNDYVRNVVVKGGKLSSGTEKAGGVAFDMLLTIDPKLFTIFSN